MAPNEARFKELEAKPFLTPEEHREFEALRGKLRRPSGKQ